MSASSRSTAIEEVPDNVVKLRDPFDFPYETKSFTYKGIKYSFRELTAAEMDECREMATDEKEKTIDGRAMMRFEIVKAATEPTMTLDQLVKCPQRLYLNFVDIVNDLNDAEALKDEDPGKSSPEKT